MTGRRPYIGKSRVELRDAILAKQVQLRKQDIPEDGPLKLRISLISRYSGNAPIDVLQLSV